MAISLLGRERSAVHPAPGREYDPDNPFYNTELAAMLAFTGLGTGSECAFFYRPITSDPPGTHSPGFPEGQRSRAPHDRGLGDIEEMLEVAQRHLEAAHDRAEGQKLVLEGHSLGGIPALILALNNPDKVGGIRIHAGAHEGYEELTPAGWLLKLATFNPEGAAALKSDSDFMVGLHKRAAEELSPGIEVGLIAATWDNLLSVPQGIKLQVPESTEIERRVVWSRFAAGVGRFMRSREGMPADARPLPSSFHTEHIGVVVADGVVKDMQEFRRKIARKSRAMTQTGKVAVAQTVIPEAA